MTIKKVRICICTLLLSYKQIKSILPLYDQTFSCLILKVVFKISNIYRRHLIWNTNLLPSWLATCKQQNVARTIFILMPLIRWIPRVFYNSQGKGIAKRYFANQNFPSHQTHTPTQPHRVNLKKNIYISTFQKYLIQ